MRYVNGVQTEETNFITRKHECNTTEVTTAPKGKCNRRNIKKVKKPSVFEDPEDTNIEISKAMLSQAAKSNIQAALD